MLLVGHVSAGRTDDPHEVPGDIDPRETSLAWSSCTRPAAASSPTMLPLPSEARCNVAAGPLRVAEEEEPTHTAP